MSRHVNKNLSEAARRRHARPVLADPEAHSPLRVARVRARKRIVDVAEAADMSPRSLLRIEHGVSPGTRSSRARLSRALKASEAALFKP